MVEKMCTLYGKKIDGTTYYAFPNIEQLIGPQVEEDLKVAKFGYRAKFIRQTAEKMFELGSNTWIDKLRNMNYDSAKKELMLLPGVGPKVKTCHMFYN
jgi:N-glycosylase/DNA lyase